MHATGTAPRCWGNPTWSADHNLARCAPARAGAKTHPEKPRADPAVAAHKARAEQGGYAERVGRQEHDLLGPQPLGSAKHHGEQDRAQAKLTPIGASAGGLGRGGPRGYRRLAQALDDTRYAAPRGQAVVNRLRAR